MSIQKTLKALFRMKNLRFIMCIIVVLIILFYLTFTILKKAILYELKTAKILSINFPFNFDIYEKPLLLSV